MCKVKCKKPNVLEITKCVLCFQIKSVLTARGKCKVTSMKMFLTSSNVLCFQIKSVLTAISRKCYWHHQMCTMCQIKFVLTARGKCPFGRSKHPSRPYTYLFLNDIPNINVLKYTPSHACSILPFQQDIRMQVLEFDLSCTGRLLGKPTKVFQEVIPNQHTYLFLNDIYDINDVI